jgi:hypothetical protein
VPPETDKSFLVLFCKKEQLSCLRFSSFLAASQAVKAGTARCCSSACVMIQSAARLAMIAAPGLDLEYGSDSRARATAVLLLK